METVHLYINFSLIITILLLLIFYRKIYQWPNYPYNNVEDHKAVYFKCVRSWNEGKKNFAVLDRYENPEKSLGKKFLIVKTQELLIQEHIYEIINDWDTYCRDLSINEKLRLV